MNPTYAAPRGEGRMDVRLPASEPESFRIQSSRQAGRVLGVGPALLAAVGAGAPPVTLPGLQPDGSVLLPNQWSLRPVGRQLVVGDFPVNVALHPAGVYAAVLHSGYGQHEVRILDVQAGRAVSAVALDESFYGLVWSPDGRRLYVSGGGAEAIQAFDFQAGYLSGRSELRLRAATEEGVPTGLATTGDGAALYVAESWGQRVEKISTSPGRGLLWERRLASAARPVGRGPWGERLKVDEDPAAPFPYACVPDEEHGRLFVSLWAKSAVLVLDAKTGADLARWPVGDHPNEMVLSPDGRLFVAEANRNSVSVLDTASGRVRETLNAALFPNAPPGSMPNSLALSPDGALLFVANANNNNIAVFDVASPGHARSLGFIPAGWFPTSVRATRDGRTLVIANGKGVTSQANLRGPFPGDTRPRDLQQYIGGLMQGTVGLITLPAEQDRPAQLGAWTKTAYACCPLDGAASPRGLRPAGNPIPGAVGGASPIKHVIYIVRENRTYDQVLGDVPAGNGDRRFCLFPENVTPNAHALAGEFVLLDNFYADGEVSSDGHEWTMAGYATDFVEKMWPLNYGHNSGKKYDYPSEGRYPVAAPANGYLWNRAAEAGVGYRTYGEFTRDGKGTPENPALASLPVLRGHVDELYPSWDTSIPDARRADRFAAVLAEYERAGGMPGLQVVQLPGDPHRHGGRERPRARPHRGKREPLEILG